MPQKFITPIQKAKDIYNKMEVDVNDYNSNYPSYSHKQAKECSLILVCEIIEELKEFDTMDGYSISRMIFWNEVKSELNNMGNDIDKLKNILKTNDNSN
jgi:hypothetical protein